MVYLWSIHLGPGPVLTSWTPHLVKTPFLLREGPEVYRWKPRLGGAVTRHLPPPPALLSPENVPLARFRLSAWWWWRWGSDPTSSPPRAGFKLAPWVLRHQHTPSVNGFPSEAVNGFGSPAEVGNAAGARAAGQGSAARGAVGARRQPRAAARGRFRRRGEGRGAGGAGSRCTWRGGTSASLRGGRRGRAARPRPGRELGGRSGGALPARLPAHPTPSLRRAPRRAAPVSGGRIRPGAAGPDSHPRPRGLRPPSRPPSGPGPPRPPPLPSRRSDADGQDVPRRPAARGHVPARPGRAEERSQGPALARAPSLPRRPQRRGPAAPRAGAPRGARPPPPAPAAGSELAHQVRRACAFLGCGSGGRVSES